MSRAQSPISMLGALVALVALGVLGYFCVYRHAPQIQALVDDASRSAVMALGADTVDVATSGRDVTLTGTVTSPAARADIVTAVEQAHGVRTVSDQLVVAEAAPPIEPEPATEPYLTRVELTADQIVVAGNVPDTAARDALLAGVAAQFPDRALVDETRIQPTDAAPWGTRMTAALVALNRLTSGRAELRDASLTVRGEAPSDALRDSITAELAELAATEVNTDIAVVVPDVAAQTEAVASCQQQFDDALAGNNVQFATSSAEIDAASDALLSTLATIASACPLARIEIAGHTDSTGDPAYNEYLSGERAAAVRTNLIARGIAAERLSAAGYGAARPIATNATAAGREQNRRIELSVSLLDE